MSMPTSTVSIYSSSLWSVSSGLVGMSEGVVPRLDCNLFGDASREAEINHIQLFAIQIKGN